MAELFFYHSAINFPSTYKLDVHGTFFRLKFTAYFVINVKIMKRKHLSEYILLEDLLSISSKQQEMHLLILYTFTDMNTNGKYKLQKQRI